MNGKALVKKWLMPDRVRKLVADPSELFPGWRKFVCVTASLLLSL